MNRRRFALFIAILINCSPSLYCFQADAYRELFPSSTKLVDVATYGSGEDDSDVTVLTVDQDGRIGVTWLATKIRPSRKVRSAEIGQAVWSSGDIDLHPLVPSTEVPLFTVRLTNQPTGTIFHALLTAALTKSETRRTASNKLYVFAEKNREISIVSVQEYDRVLRVLLDDINGDGKPELAVEWVENMGKVGGLDIWSISPTDKMSSIKVPSAPAIYREDFSTDFVRFSSDYLGPGERTIIESIYVGATGSPFTRKIYYEWDNTAGHYRITQFQEIKETIKRIPVQSAAAKHKD